MPSLTVDFLMAEQEEGFTANAQNVLPGQHVTHSSVRTFLQSTYYESDVLINSSRCPAKHCGDGKLRNICVLADVSGTSSKSDHTHVFTHSVQLGSKRNKNCPLLPSRCCCGCLPVDPLIIITKYQYLFIIIILQHASSSLETVLCTSARKPLTVPR